MASAQSAPEALGALELRGGAAQSVLGGDERRPKRRSEGDTTQSLPIDQTVHWGRRGSVRR
jgi:hypothetical protein